MVNYYDYKKSIFTISQSNKRRKKIMSADNFAIEMYVSSARKGLTRREEKITKGSIVSLFINAAITDNRCDNVICQESYFIDETIGGASSRTIYYVQKEKFELVKIHQKEIKTFLILDVKIAEPYLGQTKIYVLVEPLSTA
jgi:hypothetical protein